MGISDEIKVATMNIERRNDDLKDESEEPIAILSDKS